MQRRVVVTGLGIISPLGIGKEIVFDAIARGVYGAKPISLFDTAFFKIKTAGEVGDFKPEEILGPKGLRILDRSIKLVNSAAKLAIDDANLEISEENSRNIGVAIASTLGSVYSISEFDKESIKEGPHYVNPALFPNTVINSPASQISIRFNIKGFNATLATGSPASLDAINYAASFIRLGRAKIVLAGGVEELCLQTFLSFYKTNFLAGLKEGSVELSCPFDKRRNGILLSEGSAVFILEDLESALKRKAKIYAEILGFGNGIKDLNGVKKSINTAIQNSGIVPELIDCIFPGANSTIDLDKMESVAIKDIFAKIQNKVYISAVKSMFGEGYSVSAAMQMACALCAIEKKLVPPTINYEYLDADCQLNNISNKAISADIKRVLINALGFGGTNSSLAVSEFIG